jgi:hypothetical protein
VSVTALTLWQPWASLIAEGVKTIETRSWPAPAELIGQHIAIHAGQKFVPHHARGLGGFLAIPTITDPAYQGPQPCNPVTGRQRRIPKRAQTPTLFWPHTGPHARLREDKPEYSVSQHLPLGAIVATAQLVACVPIVAHRPDTTIAPYASAMDDGTVVARLHDASVEACPARYESADFGDFTPGRWAWLLDDIATTDTLCPWCGGFVADCIVCDGAGGCEPVPAKGRQRLWQWNPADNGSRERHAEAEHSGSEATS